MPLLLLLLGGSYLHGAPVQGAAVVHLHGLEGVGAVPEDDVGGALGLAAFPEVDVVRFQRAALAEKLAQILVCDAKVEVRDEELEAGVGLAVA